MRTKSRLLLGAALIMLLVGLPGIAGAEYMGFDNLALGNIDGKHLGTWPHGVTITSADASTYVADGNQLSWGWLTPFQVVTNDNYLVNNLMTLTFDIGRGYVAFFGGDAGGDQDRFVANAYSAADVLLGTFDSGIFGGNAYSSGTNYMNDAAYAEFNFATLKIKYVTIEAFSVGQNGLGIVIDNLEFCNPDVVPLPPSVLLLGTGILGLVGLGWRRARKES